MPEYKVHARVTLVGTFTIESDTPENAEAEAVDECRAQGEMADWETKVLKGGCEE